LKQARCDAQFALRRCLWLCLCKSSYHRHMPMLSAKNGMVDTFAVDVTPLRTSEVLRSTG
jgi:hypothetical protein